MKSTHGFDLFHHRGLCWGVAITDWLDLFPYDASYAYLASRTHGARVAA